MKVSTYAQKLAREEVKHNRFYIGVVSFAILIMIIFMHIVVQGPTNINTADYMVIIEHSLPYMLAVAASVLAMLMVYYANELYLLSHQKELGLLSSAGGKISTVASYMLAQNTVFLLYALPIALLASVIVLPILQMLSTQFLDAALQVFTIQPSAYLYTLILLITMMAALLMGNTGFIYRHDIKQLLGIYKAEDTFQIEYPMKKFMGILSCILPISGICFLPASVVMDFVFLVFAVFSTSNFLHNVMIDILRKAQRKHYLDAKKTIIYAHVGEMLKDNLGPIKLVNAAIMPIPMLLLFYQDDMQMFVIVCVFFLACLCMSGICLQHRLSETAIHQQKEFRCLEDLGYEEAKIKAIMKKEVYVYYCIIFLLPILYVTASLLKSYLHGFVTIPVVVMIILCFLVFMIGNTMISNRLYQYYRKVEKGARNHE